MTIHPIESGAIKVASLGGTEVVEINTGATFSTTTAQDIANLAPGVSAATGKTLTVNNSLTLAGTDSTTVTFPTTSATVARTDAGQTFTGVEIFASMFRIPRATVAGAGTTVSDAAAVATGYTTVTGADGTVGVVLPSTPAAGSLVMLKNNSASALKVWPDASATINAIGSNGAISMAARTTAIFVADSTTQWFTIPLLPS